MGFRRGTDDLGLGRDLAAFDRTLRRMGRESGKPLGKRRRRFAARAIAVLLAAAAGLTALPPFCLPVDGRSSSRFGLRFAPDRRSLLPEFHDALDLAAPRGTPVVSAAWGRVSATGAGPEAGNWVLVDHPFGFETYYAHLDSVAVRKGDLILLPAFGRLGAVGSTGRATGPHLHFEVRWLGLSLPPEAALAFHAARRTIFRF